MQMRNQYGLNANYEADGVAAGGGDPAAAAATVGGVKSALGSPGGADGSHAEPSAAKGENVSLRQQLALSLEETERANFQKWSDTYATDSEFAKGAVNMRAAFDGRVPLPTKDSKPEDVHKFYVKIGKPETAKNYNFEFGPDDKLSDQDTQRYEGFKEFAFGANLTGEQFSKLVEWNQKDAKGFEEVRDGMVETFQRQTLVDLRKEWGLDFEDNMSYAKAAGQHFAEAEEWAAFADSRLENGMLAGDHPTFMKAMARIGRAMSEDTRARLSRESGEAESIQAQITAIEEEAKKARKGTHEAPYHDRLAKLYQRLHPQKHVVGSRM